MDGAQVVANRIALGKARNRLAVLWFSGTGIVVAIFIVQAIFGTAYKDGESEVLDWLGTVLWPTTMLMAGILAGDALTHAGDSKEASRVVYRLAFAVCLFYLVAALLFVLAGGLITSRSHLEVLQSGRPILLVVQGAVAALLAGFFGTATTKEQAGSDGQGEGKNHSSD